MKPKHLIIIGFILFVTAAICSDGYLHPDEHFQLLEFANYKMGGIPAEHLPWEFDEQMRPTLQVVIVYGLCTLMKSIGIFDPFVATMILRLVTATLMFLVLYLFYNKYKTQLKTAKGIWWFAALSFLTWFIPYISVRYSSESFGTIFMLSALLLYEKPDQQKQNLFRPLLIGLLLGISFISRFQMGFMIFGFGMWVLFIKREKFAAMISMVIGFVIAVGFGLVCDHWFYGTWVSSAYNYFYQNLVENKAAGFGVSPFWYYAALTPAMVFPLLGIVIVPALIWFFIKYPKHIFTWLLIPFLLIHHVIGHKEMRFLFAVTPFLPFIIVLMIEHVKWIKHIRFFKYVFWVINIPALLIMTIKPAYDNMLMFKYIYRHQDNKEVYYLKAYPPFMMYQYEVENRPFVKGKDLKMTFFYHPEFYPHPANDINTVITETLHSNSPVLFVVRSLQYEEIYSPQMEKAGLKQKVKYQTYHSWLKSINFGNWISRDDVGSWTIVELSH